MFISVGLTHIHVVDFERGLLKVGVPSQIYLYMDLDTCIYLSPNREKKKRQRIIENERTK